jgi:hypothetical protein
LRIHEKDHECQIVIELKEIQVLIVDSRKTDANELVGDVFDTFKTDNLPVKLAARQSRRTTHDDHEGLAGFPGLFFALSKTCKPAMTGDIFAPGAPAASLLFRTSRR